MEYLWYKLYASSDSEGLYLVEDKLQAAKTFGATHTINPGKTEPLAEIQSLTAGRGADYVFVTVGSIKATEQGLTYLRKGGTLVIVGMPTGDATAQFAPGDIANNNVRILGSKMGATRLQNDLPKLVGDTKHAIKIGCCSGLVIEFECKPTSLRDINGENIDVIHSIKRPLWSIESGSALGDSFLQRFRGSKLYSETGWTQDDTYGPPEPPGSGVARATRVMPPRELPPDQYETRYPPEPSTICSTIWKSPLRPGQTCAAA